MFVLIKKREYRLFKLVKITPRVSSFGVLTFIFPTTKNKISFKEVENLFVAPLLDWGYHPVLI